MPAEGFTGLALILYVILIVLGIASLVLWILEIVAAFKKEESPLMGILSIALCGLGGFIIGWIHAGKWGIKKLMINWTIIVVASLVVQVIFTVVLGGTAASLQPYQELPQP